MSSMSGVMDDATPEAAERLVKRITAEALAEATAGTDVAAIQAALHAAGERAVVFSCNTHLPPNESAAEQRRHRREQRKGV